MSLLQTPGMKAHRSHLSVLPRLELPTQLLQLPGGEPSFPRHLPDSSSPELGLRAIPLRIPASYSPYLWKGPFLSCLSIVRTEMSGQEPSSSTFEAGPGVGTGGQGGCPGGVIPRDEWSPSPL